jgi:glycosyltransferase involved in cell wall biosynthesis
MLKPYLSVIIPAKNEAVHLSSCLDALKISLQPFENRCEIIVADNGSMDATCEIAKSSGCSVLSSMNGTIAAVRNLGVSSASGEVLAFLDADCLVSPEWAACCIALLEKQDIGAVGTLCIPDLKSGTWVEKAFYGLMIASKQGGFVRWIGTSNIFIQKNFFLSLGGFDETLTAGEDVNLCNRITNAGRRIYLEKDLATIHLRESKTIVELFIREFKRGLGSITSLVHTAAFFQEFPSVAIPTLQLIGILLCFLFPFVPPAYSLGGFLFIILTPLVFLWKKRPTIDTIYQLFQYYLISFIFITARSCSLIWEILHFFKPSKAMSKGRSII